MYQITRIHDIKQGKHDLCPQRILQGKILNTVEKNTTILEVQYLLDHVAGVLTD